MTSAINYLSINENFPVAGQDNDTQVFRDNFDTIKTSLRSAQTEITDLQDNTAKLNEDNDFNNSLILNAVLQFNKERRVDGGVIAEALGAPLNIDFENGSYQIYRFGVNSDIEFVNFPTNSNPLLTPGVGKVTLELYGDGTARTLNFVTSGITVLKKSSGFPAPFIVESNENPIFVEVWQHNENAIFMRYLGQFS
jgi:hypothetical protein